MPNSATHALRERIAAQVGPTTADDVMEVLGDVIVLGIEDARLLGRLFKAYDEMVIEVADTNVVLCDFLTEPGDCDDVLAAESRFRNLVDAFDETTTQETPDA